jgi:uncharacterized phage protein (TIGR01671 family)
MKRVIKFRAYHKTEKQMFYSTNEAVFKWQAESQPIEIMQFTGLTDKNGTEIYHKDIVGFISKGILDDEDTKPTTHIGIIEWNDELLKWDVLVDGKPINNLRLSYDNNEFELLGNIYQNSDLLNQ